MSFYEYVPETNTLYAVRGKTKAEAWKKKLRAESAKGGVCSTSDNEGGACVEIQGFLSDLEHAGAMGERAFKILLEHSRIPFLYIGQGPFGLELSETLKRDAGAKRPDFLISLADLGHVMVDVKVRRKVGFPGEEGEYFSLGLGEVDGLWKLQKTLGVQVWIAFAERDSKAGPLPGFWLVPMSKLKDLKDGIFSRLTDEDASLLAQLRIPQQLLHPCKDSLEFRISWSSIPDSCLDRMAYQYEGLFRGLRTELESSWKSGGSDEEVVARVEYKFRRWIQKNEVKHFVKTIQRFSRNGTMV